MNGKALVIYLMSGAETPALAEAAVAGGADLVELGFPFSDPLADGPVIRAAAERALAEGMRTQACLECLAQVREHVGTTPLVPMTYSSLLEAYGWERFDADAHTAGATGLIVADLPAGEWPELRRIQLVAPTSTDQRISLAARETDGWLYLVTITGTTGPRGDPDGRREQPQQQHQPSLSHETSRVLQQVPGHCLSPSFASLTQGRRRQFAIAVGIPAVLLITRHADARYLQH